MLKTYVLVNRMFYLIVTPLDICKQTKFKLLENVIHEYKEYSLDFFRI